MKRMERKYENVYLVTAPDEQVQNLLETMEDLLVGTLYVAGKNDWIAADFICDDPVYCRHLETETMIVEEEDKLIEMADENGNWVFRLLEKEGL